jgi:high-affinity nickel permease
MSTVMIKIGFLFLATTFDTASDLASVSDAELRAFSTDSISAVIFVSLVCSEVTGS